MKHHDSIFQQIPVGFDTTYFGDMKTCAGCMYLFRKDTTWEELGEIQYEWYCTKYKLYVSEEEAGSLPQSSIRPEKCEGKWKPVAYPAILS